MGSDDEVSPSTSTQNLSKASTANSRAAFESGAATPMNRKQYATSSVSVSTCSTCDGQHGTPDFSVNPNVFPTPANGNVVGYGPGNFAGHEETGNGNGQPYKPHDHWPAPEEEAGSGFRPSTATSSASARSRRKRLAPKLEAS